MGFKNWLCQTHSEEQQGLLRAFVQLGAPKARFLNRAHDNYNMQIDAIGKFHCTMAKLTIMT